MRLWLSASEVVAEQTLSPAGRSTLAVMAWMAAWWMTGAVPIEAAIAPVFGLPPAMPLIPATLGASCAFMMPVGTPPNAIVFGTGLVRIPQMMRAGLPLRLISGWNDDPSFGIISRWKRLCFSRDAAPCDH